MNAYAVLTGEDLRLFVDTEINWEEWEKRISDSIAGTGRPSSLPAVPPAPPGAPPVPTRSPPLPPAPAVSGPPS
jgi:hypothetical protein